MVAIIYHSRSSRVLAYLRFFFMLLSWFKNCPLQNLKLLPMIANMETHIGILLNLLHQIFKQYSYCNHIGFYILLKQLFSFFLYVLRSLFFLPLLLCNQTICIEKHPNEIPLEKQGEVFIAFKSNNSSIFPFHNDRTQSLHFCQ